MLRLHLFISLKEDRISGVVPPSYFFLKLKEKEKNQLNLKEIFKKKKKKKK